MLHRFGSKRRMCSAARGAPNRMHTGNTAMPRGWQVYEEKGRPAGAVGTVETSGEGVAAALARDGHFVLFH